jgi:hypothetical protein
LECDKKISIDDFSIKTRELETAASFAQFSVDYNVNGFDFLKKNFNKKVRSSLMHAASWMDTTADCKQSLIYQQTLFDICEIYTRQFRKALRDNRRKIAKGTKIAEELNVHYMTGFAKRSIAFDRETKSGIDEPARKPWENQIQKELTDLEDFAYEK